MNPKSSSILPDIVQVLQNQFYCSKCYSKMRGADPRAGIEMIRSGTTKKRMIRESGRKTYDHFMTIFKQTKNELDNDEPLTHVILQCDSCNNLNAVIKERLLDFLMKKTLSNEWTDDSCIIMEDHQLQIK